MDDLKNDIEKYLRGELPEAQMHALEKRALDDPFLADALEGAAGIDPQAFAHDVTLLRQQLGKRTAQQKVIPLWIWPARIAAGLLVIAVATYIIISLQPPQQKQDNLALTTEEKTPEPEDNSVKDALEESKAEAESAAAPPAPKPVRPIAAAKPKPVLPAEAPAEVADESIVQLETRREVIAEAAPPAAEPEMAPDLAREAPPVAATAPAAARKEMKARVSSSPAGSSDTRRDEVVVTSGYYSVNKQDSAQSVHGLLRVVTGHVTSTDDGTALPGVNVMIKGTSIGTVTDIRGNYQLPIDGPQTTLVYSFIGMESKEVPVTSDPAMNVSLSQDAAQLSEVVVVGYGEGKEEEEKAFPTFDMAEPVGGKRAFKKYLEAKLVYPQEALENKIEGRVTIQFTVETSGQVSNFNVIKGIGYGCDDEVIRLIKEGPHWSPMKRDDEPVKGRVRVRMRFSLPKKK